MGHQRISPTRAVSLLGPPLLVMAAIFFLSSQESSGDHGTLVVLLRKVAHVTEYAVLALCWIRALAGFGVGAGLRGAVLGGVGLTLAYATTDEFHQTFVAGRHGTPVDVLIDSIGITIAALVVLRWHRRRIEQRRALGAPADPGTLATEGRVGERLEGAREVR
jgi:L-lactate permease